MARGRDSKGRFKKGRSKKSRSRRRKRRGMGSIITVRRKGMGQIDAETLMPVAMGGGIAALTSMATRWFVDPAGGATQAMLVKWAPALGLVSGGLTSLMLFMMGGRGATEQATRAFLSASVVSLAGLGSDYLLREKPALAATIASGGSAMAGYGMGAIVPEYSRPTGAIVMEPVGPGGQRAGTIGGVGSYGEVVSLSGVNTSAFGTPGFNA